MCILSILIQLVKTYMPCFKIILNMLINCQVRCATKNFNLLALVLGPRTVTFGRSDVYRSDFTVEAKTWEPVTRCESISSDQQLTNTTRWRFECFFFLLATHNNQRYCSLVRASGGAAGGWDFPPLAPIIASSIGDVSGSDRRRLIAVSSFLPLAWPTNWVPEPNVLLSLSGCCHRGGYASLNTAVDATLVEAPPLPGPPPPLRAAQVDLSDT